MSEMRQHMVTWLRDECIKEPLRYFTLLYRLADGADLYLIEGKDAEAIEHIKTAKRAVDVVNRPELHDELDKALKYIEAKNYHDAFHALEKFMDNTAIKSFESVVECQCGKHKEV
ncbi:hypothetical protein ES704_02062 [subsurface metagenome]